MFIQAFFIGPRKILAFISVGILFGGLLSCLIISSYWFSYYNPYASHADYTVIATYYCTVFCIIFSLLGLIVLIFIVISFFFISSFSKNSVITTIAVVLLTIFSICSIIAGLLCGILGVTDINPNRLYDDIKEFNPKCHTLLIDQIGANMYDYALSKNDAKGYGTWLYKLLSKIIPDWKNHFIDFFKNKFNVNMTDIEKNDMVDYVQFWFDNEPIEITENHYYTFSAFNDILLAESKPKYSSALCSDVGVPSIIFSVVTLIGLILFAFSCCCSSEDKHSFSENEGN